MNFSEELAKSLDVVASKMGVFIDWSNQNVIPYIIELTQRYVKYIMVKDIIWFCMGIFLLVVGIMLFKMRSTNKYNDEGFFVSLGFILGFAGTILFLMYGFDIIKCLCIPELKIFEFIQSLK